MDDTVATVESNQTPTASAKAQPAASSSASGHQEDDGIAANSTTNNSTPVHAFSIRSLRSPPHYAQVEPTYYTMLGVPQGAYNRTIETAFRSKLMSLRSKILTYDERANDHLLAYSGIAELYRASHILLDPMRRSLYDRELAGGRVGYPQEQRGGSQLKDSWRPQRDGRDWPTPRRCGPGV